MKLKLMLPMVIAVMWKQTLLMDLVGVQCHNHRPSMLKQMQIQKNTLR